MDTFCCQLIEARAALLRRARARLRHPEWAEDAVSETLLAALQRRPAFSEPARVQAWLFGILRHKVVDQLRCHLDRHVDLGADLGDMDDELESMTADARHDPERQAINQQFCIALAGGLEHLPTLHARAFVMRECWGFTTADICDELNISANHLWVSLHRARARLREQLVEHWA